MSDPLSWSRFSPSIKAETPREAKLRGSVSLDLGSEEKYRNGGTNRRKRIFTRKIDTRRLATLIRSNGRSLSCSLQQRNSTTLIKFHHVSCKARSIHLRSQQSLFLAYREHQRQIMSADQLHMPQWSFCWINGS